MSTTGDFAATEGSGKKAATYTFSEDAETKFLQRIVLCDANGNEIGSIISGNAGSTSSSPVLIGPFDNKTIAASQTTAVVGATGAVGDYLYGIEITPATTSPGAVTVYDGTSTVIYTWPGGASSVVTLIPFGTQICRKCTNAGWHVTTGANVSVRLIGNFT